MCVTWISCQLIMKDDHWVCWTAWGPAFITWTILIENWFSYQRVRYKYWNYLITCDTNNRKYNLFAFLQAWLLLVCLQDCIPNRIVFFKLELHKPFISLENNRLSSPSTMAYKDLTNVLEPVGNNRTSRGLTYEYCEEYAVGKGINWYFWGKQFLFEFF